MNEFLADDGNYKLRFVQERNRYVAGCRSFTREQAVAHWSRDPSVNYRCDNQQCPACAKARLRAALFLDAIRNHPAGAL